MPRLPTFTVRSLGIAILLISVVLGRIAWNAHTNRSRGEVVRAIRALGGGVGFEEGWFLAPRPSESLSAEERTRDWFDEVFGRRTPNYIQFAGPAGGARAITDDDLHKLIGLLRRVPSVKLVDLNSPHLTADGVDRIRSALPNRRIRRGTIGPSPGATKYETQ